MILDTPVGLYTIHFHIPPPSACEPWVQPRVFGGTATADRKRVVTASLHRGGAEACHRDPQGPGDPGGCRADSAVYAEITCARRRPFRRDVARAAALAKAMARFGLNREERTHLWRAYFSRINGPLPRRCVAVITICPAGHKNRVEGVPLDRVLHDPEGVSVENIWQGGAEDVYFPSARDQCAATLGTGRACLEPTIQAKHRYLYSVDLPKGSRRRTKAPALDLTRVAAQPDDIPY